MEIEMFDPNKDYRHEIKGWRVDKYGDLVYYDEHGNEKYWIQKHRLTEEDWISHMGQKGWVMLSEFIPAYFKACEMAGIKELTVKLYGWNEGYKFQCE